MTRKADSYINDIGKRATIETDAGPLHGIIAIRFGRLVVEAGPTFQDPYMVIRDDSVITLITKEGDTP